VRVVVRWIMLDQGPELGLGPGQLRGVEVRAGQQLAYRGVVRLGLDYRLEQAGRAERGAGLEEEVGSAVLLEKIHVHAPHARAARQTSTLAQQTANCECSAGPSFPTN